ncbi:peptide ABC transporter substrate-binding protein [Oceanobacillus neutriphilus]|uniref:Peptide ABC transporter substrate-binding protein n=2 Tax=Oceanobacillus neutriphilus TaxID=531815 RepID=A0ABQ2NNG1_9BACI|nr:peptide ABC transporter substrate-binding protein [Oceanobacillus neutriphilus]
MFRKSSWLLMLLLVVSFMLAACTAESGDTDDGKKEGIADDGETEQVLRMAMESEPEVLDPQVSTDTYSIIVNNAILEGLVRFHDGEIIPGIAEEWDISEDGLTYTFHLRETTWSDGKDLTAEDFKDSFIRLLDPETASAYAYIGYYVKNAAAFNQGEITDPDEVGVKAIDPYTLEFTLENPTKQFLSLTSFISYLPSDAEKIEEFGQSYSSSPESMNYNGPFVIDSWDHQESIVLKKNPNYWNKDEIKLDEVEINIVADNSTAVGMYETGDIDMVTLGREFIEKYEQSGDAEFYNAGTTAFLQYSYNGEVGEILKNSNFRNALSYAINRQGLVEGVLKNGSTPAERYIMPDTLGKEGLFAEEYPLSVFPTENDNEKAQEYLDKALDELGMTKDELPAFELLASDRPDDRIISEALQDMFDQTLGIKTEITILPHDQRLQRLMDGEFELMWAGWGPDYNDPMTYLEIFTASSTYNTTGFESDTYDDLINSASVEADVDKRGDLLFEAEQYLIEEGPMTPVYFESGAWAKSGSLQNVNRSPFGAEVDFVFGYFE